MSGIPKLRCETCDKELEIGIAALVIEDSAIGTGGFVSLLECPDVPIFCSENHVVEHAVYDDSSSHPGNQMRLASEPCSLASTDLCAQCGAKLTYAMRTLRLTQCLIDAIGFVPQDNSGEIFCSKRCMNEFLSTDSEIPLSAFWADVLRKMNQQAGRA